MFLIGRHALRTEIVKSLYENNINNNYNTSAMHDKCRGECQKGTKIQVFKYSFEILKISIYMLFKYLFHFKFLLQFLTILKKT